MSLRGAAGTLSPAAQRSVRAACLDCHCEAQPWQSLVPRPSNAAGGRLPKPSTDYSTAAPTCRCPAASRPAANDRREDLEGDQRGDRAQAAELPDVVHRSSCGQAATFAGPALVLWLICAIGADSRKFPLGRSVARVRLARAHHSKRVGHRSTAVGNRTRPTAAAACSTVMLSPSLRSAQAPRGILDSEPAGHLFVGAPAQRANPSFLAWMAGGAGSEEHSWAETGDAHAALGMTGEKACRPGATQPVRQQISLCAPPDGCQLAWQ